jgi:hypothetical protein
MAARARMSIEEFLALARDFIVGQYPGVPVNRVKFARADGGPPIVFSIPPPPNGGAPRGGGAEPFVPTPFQEAILGALEGTALRTDALGAAVGDRSRLYRPGGLTELREQGLVKHHPRLGFYRPDCPPEALEGGEDRS